MSLLSTRFRPIFGTGLQNPEVASPGRLEWGLEALAFDGL